LMAVNVNSKSGNNPRAIPAAHHKLPYKDLQAYSWAQLPNTSRYRGPTERLQRGPGQTFPLRRNLLTV